MTVKIDDPFGNRDSFEMSKVSSNKPSDNSGLIELSKESNTKLIKLEDIGFEQPSLSKT